jgi:ribosomal protein S18 acetylase RimI-like enzyme
MVRHAVRPARPDDLPGVLTLYRHLHPRDPLPDMAAAERAWSALLSSPMSCVFVADAAGLLVSSCTLAVVPNLSRGARPYAVIENVVTHADHRRRGLGRAVLRAALDRARSMDCYKVTLATGSKEETTLAFYEAPGFVRGGKTYFEVRRQ